MNAPFQILHQTLEWYISQKGKSPSKLSACFLIPDWPGATWYPLLRGMQKLITYPAGYPLFELKQSEGKTQAMTGIPWPISLGFRV